MRVFAKREKKTRLYASASLGSFSTNMLSFDVDSRNGIIRGRSTYEGATPGKKPGNSVLGETPYARSVLGVPASAPSVPASRFAAPVELILGMQFAVGQAAVDSVVSGFIGAVCHIGCGAGAVI